MELLERSEPGPNRDRRVRLYDVADLKREARRWEDLRRLSASADVADLERLEATGRFDRRGGRAAGASRKRHEGAVKILSFTTGTFTRASDAWYYPTPTTQAMVGSNVLRSMDAPAGPAMYLFEDSRTNFLLHSEDFTNAAWVKTNTGVTGNAVVAPDGTMTADQLDIGALATDGVTQQFTCGDSFVAGGGVWLRVAAGTATVRLIVTNKAGATNTQTHVLTTAWQHCGAGIGNISSGATPPSLAIQNEAAGGAKTIYAWGAQIVQSLRGIEGSSYIRTVGATATRAADTLTWADGAYDLAALNARHSFYWSPYQQTANAQRVIYSLGSVSNEVLIHTTNSIRVFQAGALKVESNALTVSRHHDPPVLITLDPVAGSVTVVGAAAGDGTVVGTPWAFAPGLTGLRWGGRFGASTELSGRTSEPIAA